MNVARPYSVISHPLDAEVLVILVRTTGALTARRVWHLSRTGSERGVRLALQRLVEHGIVEAQPAGRAALYALNRDHLVAPVVERLARLRGELFDRIRTTIAGWEVPPEHASVFGSAARGDGDTGSDIDLLLVRRPDVDEEDEAWRDQVHALVVAVRRWTGNPVSLAELSSDDAARLGSDRPPIATDLRNDAVDLAGVPARALVRRH